MTARVVTVRYGEPVSAAVDRMTRFGFSALPVVSGSFRLVGIVSLLDALRYRLAYEAESVPADEQVPVAEIGIRTSYRSRPRPTSPQSPSGCAARGNCG